MTTRDAYEEYDFARFYDWLYPGNEADVGFYCALAKQCGSPILEVACGTGRITIPLARLGLRVVGVDLSEHMLDHARARLDNEPSHVQNCVTLVQGDMRTFDLCETFSAVFIPNASVFHLPDREALTACISNLYRHTRPGGIAVIDVVSPARMANQEVGVECVIGESINPSTGLLTRELNKKLNIDLEKQTVSVLHTYVEYNDGLESRFAFEQDYRWLEMDEGVDLLTSAGFTDIKVLGDYDGSPYSNDSPRMIAVGSRPL